MYALGSHYKPEWKDLEKRPLPQWYDTAKIGIFVHWGIYSVPGFKSEWFWYNWKTGDEDTNNYMKNHFTDIHTYRQFAPMFTAKSFKPDKWAKLFVNAGAQYVVLTTKHHDGFALFPSMVAGWNSVNVGPKKDIVDMLSKSVRKYNMKFGIYYSLYEWFNRIYLDDKACNWQYHFNNCSTYTDNVVVPQIRQLINNYRPSVLWTDGSNECPHEYWKATDIIAWLYNESPVKDEIVVNDRWGLGTTCRYGDFYTCDDRFNPRKLLYHKWENAFNTDILSWGFRKNIAPEEIMSFEELLRTVVVTISCGGNALINVGPSKEGTIPRVFRERLLSLGEWLKINGEAIYDTSPWFHQNDSLNSDVWYTCKKQTYDPWRTSHVPNKNDKILAVYAIFLKWPVNSLLIVEDLKYYMENSTCHVKLLDTVNSTPVTVSKQESRDRMVKVTYEDFGNKKKCVENF
ncbi:putative alpha-L-fucosidase [Hyposmocoma kahamanoa]|uniref:putative alpha-L-fucosidase n=1 Tax=Hyposmocoma kahamanoa TaxID=1477025 RepID=UPI000E6D9E81|nr:putative alpha-L-fucosidase [Hyposmocoma kahamanoa]